MGWNRDPAVSGHWYWHKDWGFQKREDIIAFAEGSGTLTANTSGACRKGFAPETINGESWCCPAPGDFGDGGGGDAGAGGVGGTFAFPDEMNELYKNLMNRAGEFMGRRPGFSDPMMRNMFGQDFDVLRRRGAGQAQELEDMVAGQGLLGTGTARDLYQKQGWETERGIGDLMRNLSISNELQKRKDRTDYTGAAQSLFGQGMGFNTIIEQLNAARRGESRDSMSMMLQYLMGLMSSWGA